MALSYFPEFGGGFVESIVTSINGYFLVTLFIVVTVGEAVRWDIWQNANSVGLLSNIQYFKLTIITFGNVLSSLILLLLRIHERQPFIAFKLQLK